MGDGFSDARREDREAQARQDKIDAFFDAVTDYLSNGLKREEVMEAFHAYDTLIHRGGANRSMSRQKERAKYLERRLNCLTWKHPRHSAADDLSRAWAELLTEAVMHASTKCVQRLHAISSFADNPIVVIVPNGRSAGQAQILGDFRKAHDWMANERTPFALVVKMPERALKGLRETDDGWVEMREDGWDDVRFISFIGSY